MNNRINADVKNTSIAELLFRERRILMLPDDASKIDMSDGSMTAAVTLNEKLAFFGFTLRPDDIVMMAGYAPSVMSALYDNVIDFSDKMHADPMYPDFPDEVMAMDEAEYRFHQLLHYFSTYGLESVTGKEVSKGWLPDESGTEKTEDDTSLLSLKVLQILPKFEAYDQSLHHILSKKERMTIPERDLVIKILDDLNADKEYTGNPLDGISIKFKENLEYIFVSILFDETMDINARLPLLKTLCQNTGDVIRCLGRALSKSKWHLKTSSKRTFVHLLDSYPNADLAENLWLSKAKSEKAKRYLNQISFNDLSRDSEKKEIVKAARDNKLTSFEAKVKAQLSVNPDEAAKMASSRPGWFLRMLTLFYRNGVSRETLSSLLNANADKLSVPTLVSVLNAFDMKCGVDENDAEAHDIFDILKSALSSYFSGVVTAIYGRKVYIDSGDYALEYSRLEGNQKSADGGYAASGLAYKIPDDAKVVRFFVYWNDKKRVDVDLHSHAVLKDGSTCHVGWNGDYKSNGIVTSGDITHSDAAEYVDVDLSNTDVSTVNFYIHLFDGYDGFDKIETCFTGLMAVDRLDATVKLYNPKNCFVSHEMRQPVRTVWYGYLDVVNRVLVFIGKPDENSYGGSSDNAVLPVSFSIQDYLNTVIDAQHAVTVDNQDDADVVLTLGKASNEKELSLIDENWFMN